MLNKIAIGIIVLASLFGLHTLDKNNAVERAVAANTVTMNTKYQAKLNEAYKKAVGAQMVLQENANKMRDDKDEQIRDVSARLDAALISLRKRPSRPSTPDNPKDSPVVQACTGRELYREDGEFLTREAARAEAILIERDYYYNQYEEVRKKLNGTPQ